MPSKFWPTIISATGINLINLHSWLVKNMSHWELSSDQYEIDLESRAITPSFLQHILLPWSKILYQIRLPMSGSVQRIQRERDRGHSREGDLANIPSLQSFKASSSTILYTPSLWPRAGVRWGTNLGPPTLSSRHYNLEQRMWPERSYPLEGCLDTGQLASGSNSKALLFNSFFGLLWILSINLFSLRLTSVSCNCSTGGWARVTTGQEKATKEDEWK